MSDTLRARERGDGLGPGFHEELPKCLRKLAEKVHRRVGDSKRGDGRFIEGIRQGLKERHDEVWAFSQRRDKWEWSFDQTMIELSGVWGSQTAEAPTLLARGTHTVEGVNCKPAAVPEKVWKEAVRKLGPEPKRCWDDPVLEPGGNPSLIQKLGFFGAIHNMVFPEAAIYPVEWDERPAKPKGKGKFTKDDIRKYTGILFHMVHHDQLLKVRPEQCERLRGFLADVVGEFFPERRGAVVARAVFPPAEYVPTQEESDILRALSEAPKLLLQADIAERSGHPRSIVAARLPGLEDAGLVERPKGKRKGYCLTPKGRGVVGRK